MGEPGFEALGVLGGLAGPAAAGGVNNRIYFYERAVQFLDETIGAAAAKATATP